MHATLIDASHIQIYWTYQLTVRNTKFDIKGKKFNQKISTSQWDSRIPSRTWLSHIGSETGPSKRNPTTWGPRNADWKRNQMRGRRAERPTRPRTGACRVDPGRVAIESSRVWSLRSIAGTAAPAQTPQSPPPWIPCPAPWLIKPNRLAPTLSLTHWVSWLAFTNLSESKLQSDSIWIGFDCVQIGVGKLVASRGSRGTHARCMRVRESRFCLWFKLWNCRRICPSLDRRVFPRPGELY